MAQLVESVLVEIENWKSIPEHPDYEISDAGRIRHGEKILKGEINWAGYHRVAIRKQRFAVHQLVLRAFKGPAPAGHEPNHKNGKRADNRIGNLEYLTKSQNQQHSVDVLGKPAPNGSKHGCHILTESEVLEIRALRPEPTGKRIRIPTGELKQAEIAQRYSVSVQTISLILNRTTWRHI